jgi:glucokinase
MVANSTAEAGLQAVIEATDPLFFSAGAGGGILNIGVCAPGPLDPHTGIVLHPPNLPGRRSFPLTQKISGVY